MDVFKPDALTIHVVSPEKSVNYKWEKGSDKLSRDLRIVSVDELRSLPKEVRSKYFQTYVFEEGMVFVLDKINERYYPIENANDELPQNKNRAIDNIAALLGAKSIKREIISRKSYKREFDASGNLKIIKFSADASYSTKYKEQEEKRYTGTKTFLGNYTKEGYEQALQYCKKTGLIHDPEIRRMLEDRDPTHPNHIISEEYEISLTNEVEQMTECAFSLKYLGGVFSLSGKVNESIENSNEMRISFKIEYGI